MKKRVLSALLALCLTLSLAGAAFAENEHSGDSSSAVSQAVSSVESEPQTQDETVSSGSVSGEDQTTAKTESTPAPTETPAASDVAEEEPESTPQPEAATEPDTTPTPIEDPEAEVTEKTETDGSVEYTAALETDDQTLNVIVTAPDGAFAEGVEPQLSVTMLTAEDELNDVANKLTDAEVQYDGFAALDITFTDEATGEEVEPVKSVTVRIELPQTIVDSGVDLTTLAVQHLEEDADGNVQNVTEVATLDNGITLSEEAAAAANEAAGVAPMSDLPAEEATAGDATEIPAAVAEFDVDGFSSFVITWGEGNWYRENYFTLNMIYVDDEDYDEFRYNHANVNQSMPNLPDNEYHGNHWEGETVTAGPVKVDLQQYATNIAGYKECVAIRYGDPRSGQNVTSAEVTASGKWHYVNGRYSWERYWTVTDITYTLTLYNNGAVVDTVTTTNDEKSGNIYLVYEPDPATEPTYTFTVGKTNVKVQIFVYDESTNSYVLTDASYPDYNGKNFNSWSAVNDAPRIEGYNLSYGQYNNGYDKDKNQIWTTLGLDATLGSSGKIGNYSWSATSDKTIRLYYDPVIQDSTAESVEPAPGYEKTATLNEDGTYDLTLNVKGAIGSSNNQTKVDVLMIVDTSASMTNGNNSSIATEDSSMADAEDAMKELVAELEGKEGIDANYSIVTFSGPSMTGDSGKGNDASVVLDWSAVKGTDLASSNVYAAINGIATVGGTNYQAGLVKGNNQLGEARPDAMTVVIFLSDGQPTWSYDYGNGRASLQPYSDGWSDTVDVAKEMECTYFYSVGIGGQQAQYLDETEPGWRNLGSEQRLDWRNCYGGLAYYVVAENAKQNRYYDTTEDDLTTIFNNIVASSTQIHVSNVHITDTLSDKVKAVLDQNGDPTKLEVKVTNANGDDVTSQITQIQKQNGSYVTGDNNIYPSFTNGVLQLSFPANYTLEDGYTYSVTLAIQPSAAAERDYAVKEVYPDTPNEYTGTHAYPIETEEDNQKGYFSNVANSAQLTYLVEGDEKSTTKYYPMPVVQVQKGYLSLTKALAEGANVEQGTKFEFQISIPEQYQGTYNAVYVKGDTHTNETVIFSNPQNDNDSVTAEIELEAGQTIMIALPTGIDAVIAESTEGYTPTWEGVIPIENGVLVEIQKTQKAEVTCTNTPIEVTGTLTLKKDVTLRDAESGSQDDNNAKNVVFQFKVTGPIDAVGKLAYDVPDSDDDTYFEEVNDQAVATVSVAENAPVEIPDLPVGTYTVEEVNRHSEILDGTYYFDNTVEKNGASQEVELTKDGNEVTISNTYTHFKTVIITKLVDNGNKDEIGMGDTTKKFHFTTAINGQAVSQANSETTNAVLSPSNAEWNEDGYGLANNGTMTISKLKSTDKLTIVETEANENGYHSSYTVNNQTIESTWTDKDIIIDMGRMNGNTVNVVVTNNRPVVAPTGLEDNHTKPFGLMVGVAVMAGLALAGGAVVRRRRRWME